MLTEQKVKRLLGRDFAKVKQIWQESDGLQIVLNDSYINTRFDLDGLFVCYDESESEQAASVREFFADVEKIP